MSDYAFDECEMGGLSASVAAKTKGDKLLRGVQGTDFARRHSEDSFRSRREIIKTQSVSTIGNTGSPTTVAKRLYELDGYSITQIVGIIAADTPQANEIRAAYMDLFDFRGMGIVQALRLLLGSFTLVGEAQQIDRVLSGFSARYAACVKSVTQSDAHVLSTAIIMLNGDLYNRVDATFSKMTAEQFVRNLSGMKGCNDDGEGGVDFPEDLLLRIFHEVRHEEIQQAGSSIKSHAKRAQFHDPSVIPFSISWRFRSRRSKIARLMSAHLGSLGVCRMCDLVLARYISRKSFQARGGQRYWHHTQLALIGCRLFFHSPTEILDYGQPKRCTRQLRQVVIVRHVWAELELEHDNDKWFEFRILYPDGSLWRIKSAHYENVKAWVNEINKIAALHSPPPVRAAVSHSKLADTDRFVLPLYPLYGAAPESISEKGSWMEGLLHAHLRKEDNEGLYKEEGRHTLVKDLVLEQSAMSSAMSSSSCCFGQAGAQEPALLAHFHRLREIRRLHVYLSYLRDIEKAQQDTAADSTDAKKSNHENLSTSINLSRHSDSVQFKHVSWM